MAIDSFVNGGLSQKLKVSNKQARVYLRFLRNREMTLIPHTEVLIEIYKINRNHMFLIPLF